MKKRLIKDGFGNFIVYSFETKKDADFEEKMLLNNSIKGLLPFQIQTIDGLGNYYYSIDGRQRLAEIFENRTISMNEVQLLLEQILESLEGLKKYLLKLDQVLLEPEDIYINSDSMEVGLCYLPGETTDTMLGQMRKLVEFLMNRINYKEEESVVFIYGLFRIIGEENCSLSMIQEYLKKEKKKTSKTVKEKPKIEEPIIKVAKEILPVSKSHLIEPKAVPEIKLDKPRKSKLKGSRFIGQIIKVQILAALILAGFSGYFLIRFIWSNQEGYLLRSFFGVSILLITDFIAIIIQMKKKEEQQIDEDMQRTVLLSTPEPRVRNQERMMTPYLRPVVKQGEAYIPISKTPFIIGSLKEATDGFIADSTVSRIHATIEKAVQGYLLTDLESTNGTRINQELIRPNLQMMVKHKDIITFGRKEYEFLENSSET